eukprot:4412910-Pyramimonas_sp.AAC.1
MSWISGSPGALNDLATLDCQVTGAKWVDIWAHLLKTAKDASREISLAVFTDKSAEKAEAAWASAVKTITDELAAASVAAEVPSALALTDSPPPTIPPTASTIVAVVAAGAPPKDQAMIDAEAGDDDDADDEN